MASSSKPDPCDERSLAERLLAALEKGDVDEALLIQGEVLGLHLAKARIITASRMQGEPMVEIEEVADRATEKFMTKLGRCGDVRYAGEKGTFLPLLRQAIKDEISKAWQQRKAASKHTITSLSPGAMEVADPADSIGDLVDADGFASDAAKVFEAVGGPTTLDGLLLDLVFMEEIPYKDVEPLLVLAEKDGQAVAGEAAELLGVTETKAARCLQRIRECPSARLMTYGAIKVAVHRICRRVREVLDPDDLDGPS